MKRLIAYLALFIAAFAEVSTAQTNTPDTSAHKLQLPAGFTADVVAEGIAGARHMAINKQGGVYVKLSKLKDGKGIVYLKDTNNDGKLEIITTFADYPGTGIYIKNDYLYASSNDDVYRYKLDGKGEVINGAEPEKIVVGLVNRVRDNSKAIVVLW